MTTYEHPIAPVIDCPPAERLRRVAYLIDRYDPTYDQSTWGRRGDGPAEIDLSIAVQPICETAFCIAGWTLLDAGYVAQFKGGDSEVTSFYRAADGAEILGTYAPIEAEAGRLLGLSESDARELFDPSWAPRFELSPYQALRKLANGVPLNVVTDNDDEDESEPDYEGSW